MSSTFNPPMITTSWDDGHPLDIKLSEYLIKHGIHGTFYTPRTSDRATLSAKEVWELSAQFEIGAHTLGHVDLLSVGQQRQVEEIANSKKWVEDVTSKPCTMFCPPLGRFNRAIVDMVRDAGYLGMRTVEFISIASPRLMSGVYVLPTSLQLCNHNALIYVKNSAKRWSLPNLLNYAQFKIGRTLSEAVGALINTIQKRGGCLHLWGHSWEIEEQGLWETLDQALGVMGSCGVRSVSNSGVCELNDARQ
jgi:hypothetical protein